MNLFLMGFITRIRPSLSINQCSKTSATLAPQRPCVGLSQWAGQVAQRKVCPDQEHGAIVSGKRPQVAVYHFMLFLQHQPVGWNVIHCSIVDTAWPAPTAWILRFELTLLQFEPSSQSCKHGCDINSGLTQRCTPLL